MIATYQALENTRRANILRRWPRYRLDAQERSRWAGWDWRNALYLVIFGSLISATVLEIAILGDGLKEPWRPFGLLAESSAGRAVLVLLILGNGWLVNETLADRTPRNSLIPRWIHWLRRALVSVPILGLYALPAWRWIVQTRPAWAFQTVSPPLLDLSVPSEALLSFSSRLRARGRAVRRSQGQTLQAFFLWMIFGQIAPSLALLSWLTTAESLSPGHRTLLIGLCSLCHLVACACGIQYALLRASQTRAVRWKVLASWCAPFCYLLPFPFFLMGFALSMIAAGEDQETLIGRTHANKGRPLIDAPLAQGPALKRAFLLLSRGKGELDVILNDLLPGTLEHSAVKGCQLSFYRLKTFLLLLDAAALAWILARAGGPTLRFEPSFFHGSPFLFLAALGIAVELSFLVMRVTGWFLRRGLPYQPYGRFLTFTQLALAAGLLFGLLLAAGEAETSTAGLVLKAIGLVTAIGMTLIFAPSSFLLVLPGRQVLVTLAWTGLFFELFVTGQIMQAHPELAPPFLHLFEIAILLTPVWSLALFFGLRGWILHPFELRHVFDRRLPEGARAALAAVALTGFLPLGGIAIPFWIYAHHRLWPRYERALWNLKETRSAGP